MRRSTYMPQRPPVDAAVLLSTLRGHHTTREHYESGLAVYQRLRRLIQEAQAKKKEKRR